MKWLFRKKPVVIEAEQWWPNAKTAPNARHPIAGLCNCGERPTWHIHTLEGAHDVTPGDWIITGVKGEMYPCKADIFEMTYERVEPLGTDAQVATASYETLLAEWLANVRHVLDAGQTIGPKSPCHSRLKLLLERKAREERERS